MLLKERSKRLH